MNGLKRTIFLIFFTFIFVSESFSFYDMFNDNPIAYKASFQGSIKIESTYLSYEKTNAQFSFDYGLRPKDYTDNRDQLVVQWVFSEIYDYNVSSFFVELWNNQFKELTNKLAYSVQLPSGQFIIVDKKGKILTESYFLQLFIPILNLKKNYCRISQQTQIESQSSPKILFIDLEGWDFFNYKIQDMPYRPLLETNIHFLNAINKTYSIRRKKSDNYFYWMQPMSIILSDTDKQVLSEGSFIGFYILNKIQKTLDKAVVNLDIKVSIPYEFANFQIPVTLIIKGRLMSDKTQ